MSEPRSSLATYVRLWVLAIISRETQGFSGLAQDEIRARLCGPIGAVLAAAFVFPWPALFAAALLFRVAAIARKLPLVHDSQWWGLQADLVLLCAILLHVCRAPRTALASLPHQEAAALIDATSLAVRAQMAIFYSAAAFWKLNDGFLDPRYSCAPVFVLQMLDHLSFEPSPAALAALAAMAPAVVLAIEFAVPLALLLSSRAGIFAALTLHSAIALAPPPNNIACFGVATCTRLFLLAPTPITETIEGVTRRPAVGALIALFAAAVTAATQARHPPEAAIDFAVTHLTVIAGIYSVALLGGAGRDRAGRGGMGCGWLRSLGAGGWSAVAAAAVYAYALPMLGSDMGMPNMFSNLRMHGGSNHLLLPTGLMHRVRPPRLRPPQPS